MSETGTCFGDYVLHQAAKSQSYASMQLAMFRRELAEHVPRCARHLEHGGDCAGCVELERAIARLESLAHPLTAERERYP